MNLIRAFFNYSTFVYNILFKEEMKRIGRKHWCGSSNVSIHHLRNKSTIGRQKPQADEDKIQKHNETKQNQPNVFSRLYSSKSGSNIHGRSHKQAQGISYTKQVLLKIKETMKNHRNIYSVYKFLDQNNQSSISEENLSNLLPYYGIKPQKFDFKQAISMFTENKHETISCASFIKFIKGESPPKKSNLSEFQIKNPLQQMRRRMKKSYQKKINNASQNEEFSKSFTKTKLVEDFHQTQTVQAMRNTGCLRGGFKTQKNKQQQNRKAFLSTSKKTPSTFDWYNNDGKQNSFDFKGTSSKNILMESLNRQRDDKNISYQRKLTRIRNHQQKDLHRVSQGKQFYSQNINQIFSRAQSAKILGLRSK